MNRIDRAVVAVLVLVLAVIGGSLALPKAPAAAEPTPSPSSGPEGSGATPGIYREGVVGIPGSITPLTARNRAERTLVGLIFSGLVKLGPDGTLQPDLASSWEIADGGKAWTVHIRPDATWQDGSPVTSDDVVFTVEALQTGDASGVEAAAWAAVTVDAVDDKTVEFTLDTPVADFLAALTQPLLPKHLLGATPIASLASSDFATRPVGTGPFVLTSLDASMAVLVPTVDPATVVPSASPAASPAASPDATSSASGPAQPSVVPSMVPLASPSPSPSPTPSPTPVPVGARISRVEIHFFDTAADLAAAFRAGSIDAAAGLPQESVANLATAPDVERLAYPTTTLSAVLLNLAPTQPVLRDTNLRRALLTAIDRNALVSSVLGGQAVRADTLVPPDSWAFDAAAAPPVPFDVAAAGAILKKAGWTHPAAGWTPPKSKTPFTIELLSVPSASNARLAATASWVRDAWVALGFTVNLVEVDAIELSTRLHASDYMAAVVDFAMGVEPDLYPLLASTQVRSTGANLSGYQDAGLDVLLAAARTPAAPDLLKTAWSRLEAGLASRLPILPLAWQDEVVVAKAVNGVVPRLIVGPGDRFWDVLSWRLAAAG